MDAKVRHTVEAILAEVKKRGDARGARIL